MTDRPDYYEIPRRYFPPRVGPGGFDVGVMRAHAEACQRGYLHEIEMKSWIVLYLLDALAARDALLVLAEEVLGLYESWRISDEAESIRQYRERLAELDANEDRRSASRADG